MAERGTRGEASWNRQQTSPAVKVSHSPCKVCAIFLPMTSFQVSTSGIDMRRHEQSVAGDAQALGNFCTKSNNVFVPWMVPFNLSRRNGAIALLLRIWLLIA